MTTCRGHVEPSSSSWRERTGSQCWLSRDPCARYEHVVRLLADDESTLSPPRGLKGVDTDSFVRFWLARHMASQPDILDTLYMAVPQSGKRQYTVWRDLLHGVSLTLQRV